MTDKSPAYEPESQPARPPKPALWRRLLRAIPVILLLAALMWLFGRLGVLHKLERMVEDAQMRMSAPPPEGKVAMVIISDEDYKNPELFNGTSPLNPRRLEELIAAIARGEPRVIGVDIDTSPPSFRDQFRPRNWPPHVVWEREVGEIPEDASAKERGAIKPLDVLGGNPNLNPAKNSLGLALLIDDAEDKVTRRYRRLIPTADGDLPSFPWAVTAAYLKSEPERLSELPESADDLLISYAGDRQGSHRLRFTAEKVLELAKGWPANSPIKDKIVLLGGSYLGQDRHDTPLGQMNGVDVIASVVETELNHGGHRAPGKWTVVLLELFEGVVLILLFHVLRLRWAVLSSLLLIPVIAALCSLIAFHDWGRLWHFVPLLVGLLIYELYEHYRRSAVPGLFYKIAGSSHDSTGHH